jgi:serine/threonine protein phosphatase PrpC
VSSDSSPEHIENALTQSFLACDGMLKSFLESLPLETRLSKGYCNAGSCAVVALIVRSMLYIANVGDCGAVIGRRDLLSDRVWARELSTEHNCHNANEVKLVMERSRDRNAIRLSKDDQGGDNEYGVRRVAGSLAVTRAFGDFYLKCEELSSAPFKVRRSHLLPPVPGLMMLALSLLLLQPEQGSIHHGGAQHKQIRPE